MQINVLVALLGICAGITLGETLRYGSEIAIVALMLGMMQLALYFFGKYYFEKKDLVKNRSNMYIPLVSGIFCISLFFGVIRLQFSETKNSFVCHEACTFIATVITSPEIKDANQTFSVRKDGEANSYDVIVKAPLYPRYKVGDRLSLYGKVKVPQASMEHNGARSFDYSTYLQIHNIGSEMYYPKVTLVEREDDTSRSVISSLKLLQEFFLSTIFVYVNDPASSLASGMLFGDSSMSKDLVQTFRVAGLSHIIVLSGFNIAVLIGFVLLLLRVVPLFFRVTIAGTFVIVFVLMVGAEVSIIRAVIMSFVALAATLTGRGYVARQALLLSLLLIILYEPHHLLYDVSLHLSFLATAGIVYLSDAMQLFFKRIQSKTYREIIATTLAAYLSTLPYTLYTFGTISLYALLANLLVLPLVPVVMFFTFVTVVTAPLWNGFGVFFGFITSVLGDCSIFVARLVEGLPFSSLKLPVTLMTMLIMYVFLILLFLKLTSSKKDLIHETKETKNEEIISGVISY